MYEFLGISLAQLLQTQDFRLLPERVIKMIIRQVLIGLDFLHNTCRMIHANLKPENVLLRLEDSETVS